MELQLNLTEKDYKAIASDRARRLSYKYKDKKTITIEWLATCGILLAGIPLILGAVNDLKPGVAGAAATLGLAILSVIPFYVGYGQRQRVKTQILAKWGIKGKRGKRWASE